MKTTEQLVDEVRACGQSIIDNAESIVGNYRYQTDIDITAYIHMEESPTINVGTNFIPEGVVKVPKFR